MWEEDATPEQRVVVLEVSREEILSLRWRDESAGYNVIICRRSLLARRRDASRIRGLGKLVEASHRSRHQAGTVPLVLGRALPVHVDRSDGCACLRRIAEW